MEKNRKDLLIIIPAYNEEKNMEALLDQLEQPQIDSIADILVIDDGSLDNTFWIVKNRKHALITHVYNLGYGSALQSGYKYAVRGNYKYVIQMDADGQHDICNIPRIYEKLRTKNEQGLCPDIVIGSRFLSEENDFKTSFAKKMAIGLFKGIIKISTGKKITDPTSGLQGLSRRTIIYYSQFNHFDDRYPDANMIMQMILLGFRIEEIGAVMHPRLEGTSMHSGLKPFIYMWRMSLCMLAAWWRVKLFKIDVGEIDEE